MTRYPKNVKTKKWTPLELNSIPAAWNGDTLSDGEGLTGTVRVKVDGNVSIRFQYVFRIGKKTALFQCGSYPTKDMTTIRANRDNAKKLVSEGVDPRAQKIAGKIEAQNAVDEVIATAERKTIENLTFNDLYDVWIIDGVNRIDGNEQLIRTFKLHILPSLGNIPLKDLTDTSLTNLYKKIIASEKYRTAVVVSKNIIQILTWAEKRKPYRALLIDGNPALLANITPLLPNDYKPERERYLSIDEIKKLQSVFVDTETNYTNATSKYGAERPLKKEVQLAMWICLGTVCRIGELLMSEWAHVDFKARTWFIPKENVKGERRNKQSQLVYLSDFTLKQFEQLQMLTGETKWLFPATNNEKHVCKKSASKQIGDRQAKFKKHAQKMQHRVESNSLVLGDTEWTPHDLRRTGATMMQELKITLDVIDRCQNHVLAGSKVRRHYLHYEYADEKQEAWIKLGDRLQAILNADNVVSIKKTSLM
jgi:integrase